MARSRRSLVTSAAHGDRAGAGGGRVEALLAGESLDTSRLAYDFDVDHIALIAAGPGAVSAIEDLTSSAGLAHLIVPADPGGVWAWLGKRDGFDEDTLEALVPSSLAQRARLAVGEPAHGLSGWRLSYLQARAALAVAGRGNKPVVRYRDVMQLASAVRDDLLATSLHRLYLEPLEAGRDGGEELRQTLRAYFEADRSLSEAGSAIGVTRQAVARRLKAAEERIGRPLSTCDSDLELALHLEALDATPLSAP